MAAPTPSEIPGQTPVESGEDRLIARFFRPLARAAGAFDLTDDAADSIGRKALRVNLSDLAAKGARPAGFLLTLALPAGIGDDWLSAFSAGLDRDVERYGCPLFGGDTVRSPGPVM